jgi:hypothetical protein
MKAKVFSMALALAFCSVAIAGEKCCAKKKKAAATAKAASAENKPCSAKKAKTVADESKPCCAKKADAKTASAGSTPCSAKKAKTVAGESKPCCAKKADAKTASAGSTPCSAKKATTVAGDSEPCSASKAKTASTKGGCKSKCGTKGTTVAGKSGGCKVSAKVETVLASMPHMEYVVGDQSMCCPKAAKYHADKTKGAIVYKVGDDKFKDEGTATVKLASILEEEITSMQSVSYSVDGKRSACPMTAKSMAKKSGKKMMYQVAGWEYEDKAKAEQAAKAAKLAAEKVGMTYMVDGKSYHCNMSANAKCKESGKKMTYMVGDAETPCATEAKVLVAEARIRAMIEAAAL